MSKTNYDELLKSIALSQIALEASQMFDALPVSERTRTHRAGCAGLPRCYPKMWMGQAHSNSLMFEFREVQSLPTNRLKQWKE